MNNNYYKYSVCIKCMTYNHAPYIQDALNGFSIQSFDFPYVAVIVDDASTDGNQDVILDYFSKHFNTNEKGISWSKEDDYAHYYYARHKENYNCYFAILLLKRNQFGNPSKGEHIKGWENNSKYVAICEGDDYWTSANKLHEQVSILDNNPDLMAVVTNSLVVDKKKTVLQERIDRVYPGNVQGRYTLHDFFRSVPRYPTATVMYRNTHMEEIQIKVSHTQNKYLGDWTLWAILHSYGDFYYLDDVTAAYRINPTSLTHTSDSVGRAKAHKTICKALSEVLPAEYSSYLKEDGWMYFAVFMAYRKEKKYLHAMGYLLWCLIRYPIYTINKLYALVKKKL